MSKATFDPANFGYIQSLQEEVSGPDVDASWGQFFSQLGEQASVLEANRRAVPWKRSDWPLPFQSDEVDGSGLEERIRSQAQTQGAAPSNGAIAQAVHDSVRAAYLIRAFRIRGHFHARLDPLSLSSKPCPEELEPQAYEFAPEDFDRKIFINKMLGLEFASLNEIMAILRRTYGSTLGFEFMHISDPKQKDWVQRRIEGPDQYYDFTENGKKAILQKLIEAEGFERFLDLRYTGTKRFGLEGAESLVPALEQIIKRGGQLGVREIVLGMAHRGRLNILSQVMGKPPRAIFNEFKGGSNTPAEIEGSGDVKYHLGASSDRSFDGNQVHLSLTANPSHLEIVNPVVLGKVRAKQDQRADNLARKTVMPLLIHGDAAFAGQGVVAECFGLSGLKGYRTGGSVHFIINNQIGFTTAPHLSRSSPYPSDVAKMIQAPILHVNGDDPEAVVYAAKIAAEFRQEFSRPVVIDMFCYRRHGHNEGDDPMFTQPRMYKVIREHPTTLEIYAKKLVDEGTVKREDVESMRSRWREHLDSEFDQAQSFRPNKADWLDGRWSDIAVARDGPRPDARRGSTGVEIAQLRRFGKGLCAVPKNFALHKTLRRLLGTRDKMVDSGAQVDWATAELLAFASLLDEGYNIRLSGQDSERGTFSHRHAVLVDQENEARHCPLDHISKSQGRFEVINSMLSEEAVLGFDYGYSLAEPDALVLWEAQFGDFANGAQVVVDQFLSSSERKWLRMSGLVMLLPHGYEGQGPEHSSARIERYLQLCAEDNLQVVNCTTPANYFHCLRRQLKRKIRKPLIIFTPKSLLRHKLCRSRLDEMGSGSSFHRVLFDDSEVLDQSKVKCVSDEKIRRVVICSGKVYYDLYEAREARDIKDIYLMRLEQIYPFPAEILSDELSRFIQADVVWCQEEPRNMGGFSFLEPRIESVLTKIGAQSKRARYVGRCASASTATGSMSRHLKERDSFIDEALTLGSE